MAAMIFRASRVFRKGRRVVAELIPDTMTIKRLPQLWLSLSVYDALPVKASFAVLVRPLGNDFYSLTERLETTLRPPHDLPWEVLVRGSGDNPQALLKPSGTDRSVPSSPTPASRKSPSPPRACASSVRPAKDAAARIYFLRQAVFDDAAVDIDRSNSLLQTPSTVLRDGFIGDAQCRKDATRRAEAVASMAPRPSTPTSCLPSPLVLPGAGRIAAGQPYRGFGFAFYATAAGVADVAPDGPRHLLRRALGRRAVRLGAVHSRRLPHRPDRATSARKRNTA